MSDTVRVLRVLEYVGPRALVEDAVARSIHGTKVIERRDGRGTLIIRAATIGTFPDILSTKEALQESLSLEEHLSKGT